MCLLIKYNSESLASSHYQLYYCSQMAFLYCLLGIKLSTKFVSDIFGFCRIVSLHCSLKLLQNAFIHHFFSWKITVIICFIRNKIMKIRTSQHCFWRFPGSKLIGFARTPNRFTSMPNAFSTTDRPTERHLLRTVRSLFSAFMKFRMEKYSSIWYSTIYNCIDH